MCILGAHAQFLMVAVVWALSVGWKTLFPFRLAISRRRSWERGEAEQRVLGLAVVPALGEVNWERSF